MNEKKVQKIINTEKTLQQERFVVVARKTCQ